jgi:septum site-determining protein MinD
MATSHVIVVAGGKGGVGKSTFAANYAIAAAIDSKGKVLLIDMDPKACGDIGMILGIKPKRTLLELGNHEGRIDANQMMTYVSPHSSGIHYLPSVLDPEQLVSLEPDKVAKAFQHVMNFYNLVIVDIGSDLEPNSVKALEASSLILVLTQPEIIVLHHTKRIIEKIQNLLFPSDMIKVVLNRFTPKKGILPPMVQNNLKKPVIAILPEDELTTVTSMAKAQPFVVAASRTELTKSYFMLVRTIAEQQLLEKLSQLKKTH